MRISDWSSDVCSSDLLMEMLCYSRPGLIEILPALPVDLRRGSISGMRARTFARIDRLRWDLDARTAEVRITSLRPQTIRLRAWHGIESATISNGDRKSTRLNSSH